MEQAIADAAGKDAAGRSAVRGARHHDQVGALRLGQVVQPACRRVGRDRALLDGANARDCLAGLGEAPLRLGAGGLLMGVATRCRVDGGEKDRAAGLAGEHARQGKPIPAALAAVDADDDLREHGGKATRAPRARPSGPPAMPLRSFPQLQKIVRTASATTHTARRAMTSRVIAASARPSACSPIRSRSRAMPDEHEQRQQEHGVERLAEEEDRHQRRARDQHDRHRDHDHHGVGAVEHGRLADRRRAPTRRPAPRSPSRRSRAAGSTRRAAPRRAGPRRTAREARPPASGSSADRGVARRR